MKQTIKAGDLRNRIQIMRPESIVDEYGATTKGYVLFAMVWANVRHLSGSETIKGDAVAAKVKASIRIRYRSDVTDAMRVVCDGRTYQIKAVMPDVSGRVFTDLVCEWVQ